MAIFGKDITAADLAAGNLQGSEKEKSAVSRALRFGLDQPTENVATTLRALGFDAQADSLSGLIDAPENYDSKAAQFVGEEGMYDFSALPLAVVEQAGQLGGSLLSRGIGAGAGLAVGGPFGAFIGGLLGPGLFEAVQIAGPVALERARNNGRTEPDTSDWAAALGTATFSGVLNAIGAKNIGKLNTTLVGSGVREGGTEFLQGLTEQFGSTAGTDKGLELDLRQAGGEGLIGGSAGASAQIPSSTLNTAQSLENLRQDIIGDSITNAMFDQTTPDQAVEEMGEQLMLTEQTVANIEQFEQEADQYDPDDPGAFTDEDIIQEFLTTNDQYLENQIETQFGDQLSRDEQFQLFVNVQDYIRDHFEFFDPRAENTPRDALRQIANTVTQEAGAFLDAANLEKIEAGVDPRYVGPQSMDINLNAKEELYNRGGAGITSIESGIDPNFLTQSILMQDGILDQRLPKDPNKPVNPQGLLQELGVKETDKNWFETSKRGNKKVVSELVNTEIAPFLKAKRDAGEKVTRAEIENIFYDSLNRHKSFYTTGRETQHEGGYTFKEQGLRNLFPEVAEPDRYFELWNHYTPLIPKNSTLENSPYFNRDGNDDLHNPHGDGALMWTRGFQVEHPDGSGPGTLLAENQSKLHGHSQDPGKPNKMYLSSTGIEEDASQFDAIKKRQADYNSAVTAFVAEQTEKNTNSTVLPDLLLEEPSQYGQYRDVVITPIEQDLSSISDAFAKENKLLKEKQVKESNDVFVETMVTLQPLGNLGITIDKDSFQEFMDQPAQALDVFETLGKQRRNRFNEYVLLNHGLNLRLESVTNRNYDQRTFKPINDTIINIAERPSGPLDNKQTTDRVELILDYSPKFADKYSTFNNLIAASDNYPTATEMRELEQYEARMRDTNKVIFPDYPFKNNYPAMNLRKTITLALDQGNNYIFIGSKGSGGAPPSVYRAQKKEAENIAEVIASYQGDLKAKDLFKVLPGSEDVAGGPYYALDIRPLKQLIEAKVFKGFKGYKEGGLVMNYGDYGRSYI
jgi:hypothetical protein